MTCDVECLRTPVYICRVVHDLRFYQKKKEEKKSFCCLISVVAPKRYADKKNLAATCFDQVTSGLWALRASNCAMLLVK
jgi:hypothetical protein